MTDSAPHPGDLVAAIELYLADHPAAAVLEDGRVLFDLRAARYSVTESHSRCILQLWSEERNLARTVTAIAPRANTLRLTTRRLGQPKPAILEIVPARDATRTPTTRDAQRRNYLLLLERVLMRGFPDLQVQGLRSAMDLENSFGPAYARGHLLRGAVAEAVIGVGPDESSSTIDGILTLGILWLDYCRKHSSTRRHYAGLRVIVPEGAARATAERMAWLNPGAADWRLYTLDSSSEELTPVDVRDTGNLASQLVHAHSAAATIERCRPGIDRVLALIEGHVAHPGSIEIRARSATETTLALHGLEFARVRLAATAQSFRRELEVTFGAGANETPLTAETEALARALIQRLFLSRHPDGLAKDPLFRMAPERWLESRLRLALPELLPNLSLEHLHTQVPAVSTGDRNLLDLLTLDGNGRLVVLELKADEDLHLPLQGLDYWMRVRALNLDRQRQGIRETNAFERAGYFAPTAGNPAKPAEISTEPPRLLLIAPALRIHPSNEIVLRYLAPGIDWELIALPEQWRSELKVIFRKRPVAG